MVLVHDFVFTTVLFHSTKWRAYQNGPRYWSLKHKQCTHNCILWIAAGGFPSHPHSLHNLWNLIWNIQSNINHICIICICKRTFNMNTTGYLYTMLEFGNNLASFNKFVSSIIVLIVFLNFSSSNLLDLCENPESFRNDFVWISPQSMDYACLWQHHFINNFESTSKWCYCAAVNRVNFRNLLSIVNKLVVNNYFL